MTPCSLVTFETIQAGIPANNLRYLLAFCCIFTIIGFTLGYSVVSIWLYYKSDEFIYDMYSSIDMDSDSDFLLMEDVVQLADLQRMGQVQVWTKVLGDISLARGIVCKWYIFNIKKYLLNIHYVCITNYIFK